MPPRAILPRTELGKAVPQTKEMARKWDTTKVVDSVTIVSEFRAVSRTTTYPGMGRAGGALAFPVFASKPRL